MIRAKKLQTSADAKGDLVDTITTKEDDKKYLEDLTATSEQKATDFEARQTLRDEEIQAIEIPSSRADSMTNTLSARIGSLLVETLHCVQIRTPSKEHARDALALAR